MQKPPFLCAVTLLLLTMFSAGPLAHAAPINGEDVIYKDGEVELEGFVSRPATRDLIKRPAVLIVHNWKGLKEYEKMRANMLAELGYVAFAVDIYGKGIRPTETKEAGELAGKYKGDVALYRQRLKAALDTLLAREDVDPARVAIAGYCFGGTGALELARSGADIVGAVSFHGGLGTPNPEDAKNIKGSVLVLHGAVDPHVPDEEVAGFRKEMTDAKVDWQLVYYGGAVHAFTEEAAGDDPSKGAAYDEKADKRSWKLFTSFLNEVFGTEEQAQERRTRRRVITARRVDEPQTAIANSSNPEAIGALVVTVNADGTTSFGGETFTTSEALTERLKSASEPLGENVRVRVEASREAKYDAMALVLEAAREAGIKHIGVHVAAE